MGNASDRTMPKKAYAKCVPNETVSHKKLVKEVTEHLRFFPHGSFSHGRGLNVGQFDGGAMWQHRPQFSQSRICGEHGFDHALSAPVIPDTNGVERVAL